MSSTGGGIVPQNSAVVKNGPARKKTGKKLAAKRKPQRRYDGTKPA